MAKQTIAEEFPLMEEELDAGEDPPLEIQEPTQDVAPERADPPTGYLAALWEGLNQFGLADQVARIGTHVLSISLVILVVWGMRNFYLQAQKSEPPPPQAAQAAALPTPTATTPPLELPAFDAQIAEGSQNGLPRYALLHTTIPTRPRVDVITYTVVRGDTLFGIADNFGLKPETILWGNYDVLQDNPHLLRPDQVLNILPVNGTYHMWHEGESFRKVAEFYKVEPVAIIDYPGNDLAAFAFNTDNPEIEAGTWLIIPDGRRALKDWGPPAISRANPARARYYGPGYCGEIYEGAVGNGAFVWPTTGRGISGYGYSGIHPAIDIGGSVGNAIYATDNGVVVYAGWSNYGYGYLIVIDHGNGWQSAYAHLSAVNVICGQSVFQGSVVGGLGSTGNSTGPHLHFELLFNGAKVNPLDFVQ